jgi:hypothetical protein
MMLVADNPFAILSAVAAPAILTNACSVLALGTANRIARVVDRTRIVFDLKAKAPAEVDYREQLDILHRRGDMLLKALRLFYTALAMFATTALTAIIGSALVAYDFTISFHLAAVAGLMVGALGVIALVVGCTIMVRETRLAIRSLDDEHRFSQGHAG